MKYWVYIDNKVTGPFTADKLVTLNGFTPDTLICSEDTANSGNQEWVKASNIFEFEQPAPAPAPAPQAAAAPATGDALTATLLAKLDAMTTQLTGLQTKMDGMKTKLDESIATQQKTAEEAAQRAEALAEQVTQLSIAKPQDHTELTEEENIDDQAEAEDFLSSADAAANSEDQMPLGSPKSMDLTLPPEETDATDSESSDGELSDKDGEDMVLSSALDSLHNTKIQTQEEKESTFQDLLTPVQAAALAQEAKANQEKAQQETAEKEEVLKEFTEAKAQADVVDQVIKEKEEDEAKKSMTMRWLSAGAAALAGAVGLKKKADAKKEEPAAKQEEQTAPAEQTLQEEPAPAEQPAGQEPPQQTPADLDAIHPQETQDLKEQPAEQVTLSEQPDQTEPAGLESIGQASASDVPTETEELPQEKQTLDFDNPQEVPALSIAPDPVEPKEEPAQEVMPEETTQPAEPVNKEEQAPAQDGAEPAEGIPSLQDEFTPVNTQEEPTQPPMQELVPNATSEAPDDIITDADLQDAFTERKAQEDSSVEQLFGLASAGAAVAAATAAESQETKDDKLPSLEQADTNVPEAQTPKDGEAPEIELKAGSTYLISDFVPPALSSNKSAEKTDQEGENPTGKSAEKGQEDDIELQEIVTRPETNETEEKKPAEQQESESSDVTVSQIVLENTIKAKRGAALDIKTVPMVPEPAQSDRLQLDDMDDINTQHDLKSADVEPAGKGVRMAVGMGVIVLLLGLIYGMLAFMNLIPEKFNLLAKPQPTAEEQQDAQLSEMLPENTLPVQTVDENAPVAGQETQDVILTEVKNYPLPNGMTLEQFVQAKHPAVGELITWEISTAVDPDNYSVLVKVPPENPQSFKISYRFNYNTVTKALDPTISDAKNLLDSAQPQQQPQEAPAQ